jgi:hypothetical protein
LCGFFQKSSFTKTVKCRKKSEVKDRGYDIEIKNVTETAKNKKGRAFSVSNVGTRVL